ncbi:MAG: hypothetical protein R6U85_09470, partial [Salinivirgaceae bacterium]
MRNAAVYLLAIVFLSSGGNLLIAQIHEPEGLNMSGSWDGWTNPPDVLSLASSSQQTGGEITRRAMGTAHYHTTIQVAASGGDITGGTYDWLFTSGPTDGYSNNKWANTTVVINTIQEYTHQGGSNNSATLTNGKWYTVNFEDKEYVNTNAVFMETSAEPVTFSGLTFSPNSDIKPWETVTVTLTASAAPCAEENVFLRYSTASNFTNSTLVEFSFTGTAGTAQIPNFDAGTTVYFYAFSSTFDAASIDPNFDMLTINYINNSGSNYSYSVITPTTYETVTNGNFNEGATWVGGGVPPSGSHLSVSDALVLNTDYIASGITINSGGNLSFSAAETLTVESFGQWTNDGAFTAGNGAVKLESDVAVGGSVISTFNNV